MSERGPRWPCGAGGAWQIRSLEDRMDRVTIVYAFIAGALATAIASVTYALHADNQGFMVAGIALIAIATAGLLAGSTVPRYHRRLTNIYQRVKQLSDDAAEDGAPIQELPSLMDNLMRYLIFVVANTTILGIGVYFIQNANFLSGDAERADGLQLTLAASTGAFLALQVVMYVLAVRSGRR